MPVTLEVLKEIHSYLIFMVERQSDYEPESFAHQEYLKTIGLMAKVTSLIDHMRNQS